MATHIHILSPKLIGTSVRLQILSKQQAGLNPKYFRFLKGRIILWTTTRIANIIILTRIRSMPDVPQEFISYHNVEMRLVVHEFKALYGEQLKLRKFPANLFRDDEVKAHIQHFIQEERAAHLKGLKSDLLFEAPKPLLTLREANTVSLTDLSKGSKQSADEEIFSAFTHLLPKNKQVETVNLQEIYVAEKGPDALRQFNINFHLAQKKEVPCLEKKARNLKHGRRASHDDSRKQPAVVEKAKAIIMTGETRIRNHPYSRGPRGKIPGSFKKGIKIHSF